MRDIQNYNMEHVDTLAPDTALGVVATPFILYGTGGVYLLGIVIQSFEVLALSLIHIYFLTLRAFTKHEAPLVPEGSSHCSMATSCPFGTNGASCLVNARSVRKYLSLIHIYLHVRAKKDRNRRGH